MSYKLARALGLYDKAIARGETFETPTMAEEAVKHWERGDWNGARLYLSSIAVKGLPHASKAARLAAVSPIVMQWMALRSRYERYHQ